MSRRKGIPKGSRRIPIELRIRVAGRIRTAVKPYIKANGEWKECCDAAKSLKLHPQTVWSWYNGRTLPTIWNLIRFADLYEVSIDYLFGRINTKSIVELRKAVAEVRKSMVA